jgi:hypothetical protein
MNKNQNAIPETKESKDLLEQYLEQTSDKEDIHFTHSDWIYSDSSGCCC